MSVPIKYKLNDCGVVIHPTVVFENEKHYSLRANISIGSDDGVFWDYAVSYFICDRGMGSPCSIFRVPDREHAILLGVYQLQERIKYELSRGDLPIKGEKYALELLKILEDKFGIVNKINYNCNLLTLNMLL